MRGGVDAVRGVVDAVRGVVDVVRGSVDAVLGGAGSWDETLRLWHRISHPNNTPKASSGVADTTQANEQEVS